MSDQYIGEIRMFGGNFAPTGWALCNGQLLPINQNQALFSLLGTTYGGDGRVNFALPDLRDRVPVHVGSGTTLGERGGESAHTLSTAELPAHVHTVGGTSAAAVSANPSPATVLAASVGASAYAPPSSPVAMAPDAMTSVGGSQPHQNMPPYLTISFCIALQGIFPSQN